MKINRILITLFVLLILGACKDDDVDGTVVEVQTLAETLVENDTEIQTFLQTHFYNYEEFDSPSADFDFKINIDTIAGDNLDKIPLIDQMQTKTISILVDRFSGVEDEDDVEHTFYYLEAREGEGIQPSVADSTYIRYKGSLLDGTTFDEVPEIPIWFDLASIQGSGARGFAEGTSLFKSGGQVIENEDGTFTVENYGVGLVIFPSGLGYFSSAQTNIPSYSPLIFEIDVFAVNETDHDLDGIPSIQEDVNGNGYMFDDLDDTDEDGFPNYLDQDDDGDGTLTIDEISDDAGNIIIPYPDTDGDGTPDYLDADNS